MGTEQVSRCSSNFVPNPTSTALGILVWQYVYDAVVLSSYWEEYPYLGAYHAGEIALLIETIF